MDRRAFIAFLTGTTALAAVPKFALAREQPLPDAWAELRERIGDRLISVRSPLDTCAEAAGAGAEELFRRLKNPYYLGDEPGLTQTLGWTDAWVSRPSLIAVAARDAADVAAAVDFARTQGLRLVVKGGGHSYFGNSNAADSLLVWTRRLEATELHDAFVPQGASPAAAPVPAISVGAGAIWGRVYAAAARAGRYVQGGGCLTVGVAGFVQGGGFGWFSKQFGTGAANLLEAEVVTADGTVRTVNAYREPDLFHALRGGGGGTFGVVTRLTLRTYPLPSTIGAVLFDVSATSDPAWRALVERIVAFYASKLFKPTWGEQMRFRPGRRLQVSMLCHGLTAVDMEAVWRPFLDWVRGRPDDYFLAAAPTMLSLPAAQIFDPRALRQLPGIVLTDDRPGESADNVFWATNQGEAGQVLYAYQSAWLPQDLLRPDRQGLLVEALVKASAEWTVSLHTNKGLGGGSAEALAATRETATNPAVLNAFALLICAAEGPPAWPGIPGHEPDLATSRREAAGVARAMTPIETLVPNAGCYMSEADFFHRDWRRAYWGGNYDRLAAIKRRYDPANLFRGHHTVTPA